MLVACERDADRDKTNTGKSIMVVVERRINQHPRYAGVPVVMDTKVPR